LRARGLHGLEQLAPCVVARDQNEVRDGNQWALALVSVVTGVRSRESDRRPGCRATEPIARTGCVSGGSSELVTVVLLERRTNACTLPSTVNA
jgi:hypothetical protein